MSEEGPVAFPSIIYGESQNATEITLYHIVYHYSSYLLRVDGHVQNGAFIVKQRVLRYDEDPLAGVKNFENFALFCRNKEGEDIRNGGAITGLQSSKHICKRRHTEKSKRHNNP